MKSADFRLGIGHKLFGHWLDFSGLNVQPSLKNVGSPKRTDTGLVALHSCKIIGAGFFQKLTYTFHFVPSIDNLVPFIYDTSKN